MKLNFGFKECSIFLLAIEILNLKFYYRNVPKFTADCEIDATDKILNNRNIGIKKASGTGATELILHNLIWKILV